MIFKVEQEEKEDSHKQQQIANSADYNDDDDYDVDDDLESQGINFEEEKYSLNYSNDD